MMTLTTDTLVQACRIFFSLAYPDGEATVPGSKSECLKLPPGQSVTDPTPLQHLPPGLLEVQWNTDGSLGGYALRLGCRHFPHLKLRAHRRVESGREYWLFTVDTHDAFSRNEHRPPPDHPDAPAWMALQKANADLKVQIERAWEAAGLETFNSLLRASLG